MGHKSPIGQGNECKNAPSIKVLSVDHKNGELGQYFNFNVEDVTRMLGGRTDWNGKTFTVRNRRDGATERVIVWRQPNGGSIGNAHGRRDPHKYSSGNDWKVGDELVYRPGDYSACADEFECRADTSCLKKKKDFGCWQIKDRETCLSSKDGRAYHGHLNDACVWCGGARCTTNNDNKCEPQTWLLSRSNQVEPNKYEYASDSCRSSCLNQQKDAGCNGIKDRDTCLSSKDGRFDHMSDPCVWCGGASCTTDNDNHCEPQAWLLARDNQVEPDKYEYADGSCETTSMTCQACADGYYPQEGDIPGWGMGGQSVASCQACAELCTANDKCNSFECSATELRCNLNEEADPSQGKYKDYMFCTKEE